MHIQLTSFRLDAIPVVAVTWLTFLLGAVISFFFQYRLVRADFTLKAFVKHCFPFDGWRSKSNFIDIVMYVVSKFIGVIVSLGDAAVMTAVALGTVGLLSGVLPGHVPSEADVLTSFALGLLIFVVGDFANYLTHYWQHKVAFLWELHKVHHSATFLTPLTTKRMHPLGDKLDQLVSSALAGIPAGVAAFHYNMSFAEIAVLVVTANKLGTFLVLDALRHSHFPISFGWANRILVSPHMHQLHHSTKYEHWDKNLGNKLSIWDWMFGTAVLPEKGEVLQFGIGRGLEVDRQYETVRGVYWEPMVKMFGVLTGKISREVGPPAITAEDASLEPIHARERALEETAA